MYYNIYNRNLDSVHIKKGDQHGRNVACGFVRTEEDKRDNEVHYALQKQAAPADAFINGDDAMNLLLFVQIMDDERAQSRAGLRFRRKVSKLFTEHWDNITADYRIVHMDMVRTTYVQNSTAVPVRAVRHCTTASVRSYSNNF